MSTDPTPSPSTPLRSSGSGVRILLTVVIVLLVLGGIGVAAYFAGPSVYERFVVSSDTNSARLTEIEQRQTADMSQVNEQIIALQARLNEAENRQTAGDLALSELKGTLSDIDLRLAELQQTVDGQQSLLSGADSPFASLEREIALVRATELLSRSRLYLLQSNFGFAREDVQAARDLVLKAQLEAPETQASSLGVIVGRLDMALSNLPAFPVIAADDINVAWELLVQNLPAGVDEPPATNTTTSGATDTTTTTQAPTTTTATT